MSVIIRLQNLPWSATSSDIRQFFKGLSIPEGGVQIVGGQMGDAFIAFSTDEDARQAMMHDRKKINNSVVRLLLSSRTEMQRVIETARQHSMMMGSTQPVQQAMLAMQKQQQMIQMMDTKKQMMTNSLANGLMNTVPSANIPIGNNLAFPAAIDPTAFIFNYQQQAGISIEESPVSDPPTISLLSPEPQDRIDNDLTAGFLKSSRSSRSRSRSRSPRRERFDKRGKVNKSKDRYRSRSRSPSPRRVKKSPQRIPIGSIRVKQDLDISRQRKTRDPRLAHRRSPSEERSLERDVFHIIKNDSNSMESQPDLDDNADAQIAPWDIPSFMTPYQSTRSSNIPGLMANTSGIFSVPSAEKQTPFTVNMPGTPSLLANDDTTQVSINATNYDIFTGSYLLGGTDTRSQSSFSSSSHDRIPLLDVDEPEPVFAIVGKDDTADVTDVPNHFESILTGFKSGNAIAVQQKEVTQLPEVQPTPPLPPQLSQMPQKLDSSHPDYQPFVTNSSTISFATSNPYAHIYPNLFAQQTSTSPANGRAMEQCVSSTTIQISSDENETTPCSNDDMHPENEENLSNSSCVKITNMCNSTSYSDLRKFFSGLYIPHNGIKMINDNHGVRTGVAFVHFSRPNLAQKAVQRNDFHLKGKLVNVEQVSENDFENAEDSYRPPHKLDRPKSSTMPKNELPQKDNFKRFDKYGSCGTTEKSTVLFVEDMPNSTTEQDLMKLFSNYSLYDIVLKENPRNRRELQAFVKFSRHEDAQAALEDKRHHMIGYRKVCISASTEQEMERFKQQMHGKNESKLEKTDSHTAEFVSGNSGNSNKNATVTKISKNDELTESNNNKNTKINNDDSNADSNAKKANNPFSNNRDPRVAKIPSIFEVNTTKVPSIFEVGTSKQEENVVTQTRADPRLNKRPRVTRFDTPSSTANTSSSVQTTNHGNSNVNSIEKNASSNGGVAVNAFPQQNPIPTPILLTKYVLVTNCDQNVSPQDLFDLMTFTNLKVVHIEPLRNERNMFCGEFVIELGDAKDAENCLKLLHLSLVHSSTLHIQSITPQQIADRLGKPFLNYMPSQMANNKYGQNFSHNYSGNNNNNNRQQTSGFSRNQRGNSYSKNVQNFSGGKNMAHNNANNQHGDNGLPDKFRRPGCVVNMENVPYKADLRDIQQFFKEFRLAEEDIIRRFNDDGTPTGDARVSFKNPTAARNAVDSRKRKMIFNRTIYLSIL